MLDHKDRRHPVPPTLLTLLLEGFVSAFVWIGIVLLVLWALLWLGFHVVTGLVHLLVIAAVVFIIWGLVKKGARAVNNP